MSAELCRRPGALPNYIRLRRQEGISLSHQRFWEGRISNHAHGEPISSRAHLQIEDDVSGHAKIEPPRVDVKERTVYSRGWGGPSTIAEVLRKKGLLPLGPLGRVA